MAGSCRWAPDVAISDLLNTSSNAIVDVFRQAGQSESAWVRGPGIYPGLGMTRDGASLNYTTGEVTGPHQFSAPSKEGFHLGIAARCMRAASQKLLKRCPLRDDEREDPMLAMARNALTATLCNLPESCTTPLPEAVEYWVDILESKIAALAAFNKTYPGFASHLPWYNLTGSGSSAAIALLSGWIDKMPALDNGEMFWGLVAAAQAAQGLAEALVSDNADLDKRASAVAAGLRTQWQAMADAAPLVFWGGSTDPSVVASIVTISNVSALPSRGLYSRQGALEDPYEGELYTWVVDLFGGLTASQRLSLWELKRQHIASIQYSAPSGQVAVQQGFWFSAHEQMKILYMPYTNRSLVPVSTQVFEACEVARAWDSVSRGVPGLFASVTDVAAPPVTPTTPTKLSGYISAAGIQALATQPIDRRDVVTPYGAMAMAVVRPREAAAWYVNTLQATAMQGPVGSSCGCNVNGTEIAPVVTWDSKASTLLGLLGGTGDIVAEVLASMPDVQGPVGSSLLDRFATVVEREMRIVFGDVVQGASLPVPLPNTTIPASPGLKQFTNCN